MFVHVQVRRWCIDSLAVNFEALIASACSGNGRKTKGHRKCTSHDFRVELKIYLLTNYTMRGLSKVAASHKFKKCIVFYESEMYYLDPKSLTMNPSHSARIASTMCEPFQKRMNFKLGVGDVVRLMVEQNEQVVS
jgi:hypothetical protein